MTVRGKVGLVTAVGLPVFLGVCWWCAMQAGVRGLDGWSVFWVAPTLLLPAPLAGFALGWLGTALVQAARDERRTRVPGRQGDALDGGG
jgi:hypothetical protein